MKIDFHIHNREARCSNLDPREAVRIAEEKGLDVIAVIQHDTKPKKYKGSKKVRVIPGIEVNTKQGHVLVINTTKEFKKGIDAQELINQAPKDSLVIIAHPFDYLRKGMGNAIYDLKGYHAIEVNARCLYKGFNNRARRFAKEKGVPLIAGSDSHFPEEIGNAHTIVNASTISEAIKKVKQGKTKCYIKKRLLINKLKYFIKSMILEARVMLKK